MAHYIHHIPGRLRVRNPMFKDNPPLLEEARHCFQDAAGIKQVSANALTGSLTVRYDPDTLSPDRILQIFEECEYVDTKRAHTLDTHLNESFNKAGKYVGRAALSVMVDTALKGSGLSFLSALI